MAVNLRAPFILLQESIAPMRARGGGSVINIGSVLAYVGEPKLGAYSVSKGGLMTLTKNAASLLNRDRIRVNQINVGWTLTEGERRVKREQEGKGDDWIEAAIATWPFGRLLLLADSPMLPRILRRAPASASPAACSISSNTRQALVGPLTAPTFITKSRRNEEHELAS